MAAHQDRYAHLGPKRRKGRVHAFRGLQPVTASAAETRRDRQCHRGDGVPKARLTETAARDLAAQWYGYNAYECSSCGWWHVGRIPGRLWSEPAPDAGAEQSTGGDR
jgi:hypothetical protein